MKNQIFEKYYLKYSNLVLRIAMDRIGNYEDAQEICQHVFIAFYQSMDDVSEDLVKAWLIRCTKNAIVDYYRRVSREKEFVANAGESEIGSIAIDGGVEPAEVRLDSLDLMGKVLREVKKVNRQWFEVLFLNCVEGLSYTEMAKRLCVSETVLRARLYRARMYVREKFGDDYQKR